ncbi:response regulator [Methylobacterium oryzihabitans]|uniref:Response regulator n=1 Tax=Methylobacterium oryzihabitans TaxID=2499852 RepID=A0A437P7A2_9HYPH|nr:response regulator [Methylobacterium oryzihabitans]RVU18150.1 response regulator [Methylobacterium oryzihabitans]
MTALTGRRVLLVEDESLVAMLAEDMLLDWGCEVAVAMRLEQALALVRDQTFDLAILDVNLGTARSYPVADELLARAIPFLFATGYGRHGVDHEYRDAVVIQKPYQGSQMRGALERLLADAAMPGRAAAREGCLHGAG